MLLPGIGSTRHGRNLLQQTPFPLSSDHMSKSYRRMHVDYDNYSPGMGVLCAHMSETPEQRGVLTMFARHHPILFEEALEPTARLLVTVNTLPMEEPIPQYFGDLMDELNELSDSSRFLRDFQRLFISLLKESENSLADTERIISTAPMYIRAAIEVDRLIQSGKTFMEAVEYALGVAEKGFCVWFYQKLDSLKDHSNGDQRWTAKQQVQFIRRRGWEPHHQNDSCNPFCRAQKKRRFKELDRRGSSTAHKKWLLGLVEIHFHMVGDTWKPPNNNVVAAHCDICHTIYRNDWKAMGEGERLALVDGKVNKKGEAAFDFPRSQYGVLNMSMGMDPRTCNELKNNTHRFEGLYRAVGFTLSGVYTLIQFRMTNQSTPAKKRKGSEGPGKGGKKTPSTPGATQQPGGAPQTPWRAAVARLSTPQQPQPGAEDGSEEDSKAASEDEDEEQQVTFEALGPEHLTDMYEQVKRKKDRYFPRLVSEEEAERRLSEGKARLGGRHAYGEEESESEGEKEGTDTQDNTQPLKLAQDG